MTNCDLSIKDLSLEIEDASGGSGLAQRRHERRASFMFQPLSELLNEPDEEEEWVVDGLLIKSGISICAGKPKAGKTTLARQLAYCVATGQSFLGRETVKGLVLYLALEEKRSEVKKHFRDLGAVGTEEVLVHAAAAPQRPLAQLEKLMDQYEPALVIIDPLFKFTRVGNSNDYSEVTNALEDVVSLARDTKAHILLVHHLGKGEREGADGILGSTAIYGAVDAAILLNRSESCRKIKTIQRYGTDLEERTLEFDEATRYSSLGPSSDSAGDKRIEDAIIKFLKKKGRSCTQEDIFKSISGRKDQKINALHGLQCGCVVSRSGEGKRGDPFTYTLN